MKRLRLLASIIAFCAVAQMRAAQPVVSYTRFCATCGIWGADTFESESGQFIVHGHTGAKFAPVLLNPNARPLLELEPQLVAVTAERIKRVFLHDLGLSDSRADKIHIIVLDLARPDQPIGVVSRVHTDGFQYQVGLPGFIEHERFVKALVHALLLELANRGSHRCAELPAWLVDGFSRQILSNVTPGFVVNKDPVTFEIHGYDRLGSSRTFLQTNTPLSIQELSFDGPGPASPLDRQRFDASAHLLVFDLLRVRGGSGLMVKFLQMLPQTYNWQTALLAAYGNFFQTPLGMEKWWTLNCLDARNHDKREIWPIGLSLQRLDSLLLTPMELRIRTNAIPQRPQATLQEIIYSTDFGIQKEIFSRKLQQLFFLSVNLAPEARVLADGYENAIQSYVQKRGNGDTQPSLRMDPEQRGQFVVKSAIRALDELDRARDNLRSGRGSKVITVQKTAAKRAAR